MKEQFDPGLAVALDALRVPPMTPGFADRVMAAAQALPPVPTPRTLRRRVWGRGTMALGAAIALGVASVSAAATLVLTQFGVEIPVASEFVHKHLGIGHHHAPPHRPAHRAAHAARPAPPASGRNGSAPAIVESPEPIVTPPVASDLQPPFRSGIRPFGPLVGNRRFGMMAGPVPGSSAWRARRAALMAMPPAIRRERLLEHAARSPEFAARLRARRLQLQQQMQAGQAPDQPALAPPRETAAPAENHAPAEEAARPLAGAAETPQAGAVPPRVRNWRRLNQARRQMWQERQAQHRALRAEEGTQAGSEPPASSDGETRADRPRRMPLHRVPMRRLQRMKLHPRRLG